MSMIFLLPDPATTLADFRRRLIAENWEAWMGLFRERPGRIHIPRFHAQFSGDIAPSLSKLGLRELFTPKANLTGICDGKQQAFFHRFKHRTVLEVTEEGGAPLAQPAMKSTMPPVDITINRPFLVAICDRAGALLYLGSIMNPG